MDREELIKWMKAHGIDEQLRLYFANDVAGRGEYGVLEDLAIAGSAIIKITMLPSGQLQIEKISQKPIPETIESEVSAPLDAMRNPVISTDSRTPSKEEVKKPRSRRRTE
jgi:hypothetical protein